VCEEELGFDRLFDVNEGEVLDTLDLASVTLGHFDSSHYRLDNDLAVLAIVEHNILDLALNDKSSFLAVEDLEGVLVSASRSTLSSLFMVRLFVESDSSFLVVLNDPLLSHEVFYHGWGFDCLLCRSGLYNWFGLLFSLFLFFRGGLGSISRTGS
jgi:hypothetical protein